MNQIYKILTYDNAYDLENAVNDLLNDGWETSGNLAVSAVRYRNPRDHYEEIVVFYAQVMRKLPEAVLFNKMQAAASVLEHSKN